MSFTLADSSIITTTATTTTATTTKDNVKFWAAKKKKSASEKHANRPSISLFKYLGLYEFHSKKQMQIIIYTIRVFMCVYVYTLIYYTT